MNGGMSGLRMRSGWCGLRGSSGGWGPADTGGVQEALDALQTHAVGCGERGGGGAVAVGGDQVRDLALTEAVTQAPRMLRARSRGTNRAAERHGVAKSQVSGLSGVRVSGKHLHHRVRIVPLTRGVVLVGMMVTVRVDRECAGQELFLGGSPPGCLACPRFGVGAAASARDR